MCVCALSKNNEDPEKTGYSYLVVAGERRLRKKNTFRNEAIFVSGFKRGAGTSPLWQPRRDSPPGIIFQITKSPNHQMHHRPLSHHPALADRTLLL